MATTTRTRKITREQIAAAVGNNPRLIKLLEALTQDVSETLPGAVNVNTGSIDEASTTANIAVESAAMALAAADMAMRAAQQAQELLQMIPRTNTDDLRRCADDLQTIISTGR